MIISLFSAFSVAVAYRILVIPCKALPEVTGERRALGLALEPRPNHVAVHSLPCCLRPVRLPRLWVTTSATGHPGANWFEELVVFAQTSGLLATVWLKHHNYPCYQRNLKTHDLLCRFSGPSCTCPQWVFGRVTSQIIDWQSSKVMWMSRKTDIMGVLLSFSFFLFLMYFFFKRYLFKSGCAAGCCLQAFSACGVGSCSIAECRLRCVGPSAARRPWSAGQALKCTGLDAAPHVESSQTRDQTRVPRIGRRILTHRATGEVWESC